MSTLGFITSCTFISLHIFFGISMKNAKVELLDVALKGCSGAALFLLNSEVENTVVATRCEFATNDLLMQFFFPKHVLFSMQIPLHALFVLQHCVCDVQFLKVPV